MRTTCRTPLVFWAILLALPLACSDDDAAPLGDGPFPSIQIATPVDGARITTTPVAVDDEVEVPVELTFEVKNFMLKAPGTCAGASGCGHINIMVNGEACNDVEADGEVHPFNEQAFSDEGDANLFYCPGFHFENGQIVDADGDAVGQYVIAAQLADDDESPVKAAGKAVSDSISVTVEIAAGMGEGGAAGSPGAGGVNTGTGGAPGGAGAPADTGGAPDAIAGAGGA